MDPWVNDNESWYQSFTIGLVNDCFRRKQPVNRKSTLQDLREWLC
jgi:hypothetical protein